MGSLSFESFDDHACSSGTTVSMFNGPHLCRGLAHRLREAYVADAAADISG
jgi:hypothetical protein